MNIAIDGYEANIEHRVGIGRFAFEVLDHLYNKLKGTAHTAMVYLPAPPLPHMPPESSQWKYVVATPKRLWTFIGLPLALRRTVEKPDVLFSPTHYIPRFTTIPTVMAIMDVSYLHYPELFDKKDLIKLKRWTEYSARHSKIIITISQFSKRAIISSYTVPSDRVHVVYPALSHKVSMSKVKKIALEKFGINGPYILSVGTLQPRKNFVRVIEAYAKLNISSPLVIVGKKGWLYEDILAAPKRYHIEEKVKFLNYVTDAELPVLYEQASFFILASLYEGFGLPVLEAMAHNTSVVVSNVSSLPEIAGDAGIYVDPENVESIRKGMEQALAEAGTQKEKKRVTMGKERVALFSWDKAAGQVLEILEAVGNKS